MPASAASPCVPVQRAERQPGTLHAPPAERAGIAEIADESVEGTWRTVDRAGCLLQAAVDACPQVVGNPPGNGVRCPPPLLVRKYGALFDQVPEQDHHVSG